MIDRYEKIEIELVEYIDRELYLPVKAELHNKGITHSLGLRKEGLKGKIYELFKKLREEDEIIYNYEDQIKHIIILLEKGWFAVFHKAFRVGDYTKDGIIEMFLYDLISKDLHLYPIKRKQNISNDKYAKYLIDFIISIGNNNLIKLFNQALFYTLEEMEKENDRN